MHILAVSHDSTLYGAQRSFFDALDGLKKRGHLVEACAPREGPLTELLRGQGIVVHIIDFQLWIPPSNQAARFWFLNYAKTIPGAICAICQLALKRRFDAVYTNTITVLDFAIASKLLGVPHVWHIREAAHGNPQLRGWLSNHVVRKIAGFLSKKIIFNSIYLKRKYVVVSTKKDVVIYNGIDSFGKTRRASKINTDVVKLVTIGFMEHRKGLDVILDALYVLSPEFDNKVELLVLGDIESSYMSREIQPRLNRLSGRNSVVLKGWTPNVEDVLFGSDILVSSARDEPFGRTIVEGMLAGLPVVSTRSGGPEEIVEDRVTGRLVSLGRPDELAQAISELVRCPKLRRELGEAGALRAKEKFNLRRYVDEIEAALVCAIQ